MPAASAPPPLHIGIVCCSAEGAALCYRTICTEAPALLGRYAHPEVSMHGYSLARYQDLIERDDWAGVAELMLASARKLEATGAQLLICPDNTLHRAFPHLEGRSPLPWLHIAEVVAAAAAERGFRRLGLTGTRWLVAERGLPGEARRAWARLRAARRGGPGGDQPHHHGGAGRGAVQARSRSAPSRRSSDG